MRNSNDQAQDHNENTSGIVELNQKSRHLRKVVRDESSLVLTSHQAIDLLTDSERYKYRQHFSEQELETLQRCFKMLANV